MTAPVEAVTTAGGRLPNVGDTNAPAPMTLRLPALLAVAAFSFAASAQTSPVAWNAAPAPPPTEAASSAASLDAYAGHYASDGGGVDVRVDVRAGGPGLVVLAYGAPVAARLVGLAPRHAAVDGRAQSLLDAWVAGDLGPVVAAAAPDDGGAARRFGAHRMALVMGLGEPVASSVVGTFRQTDGRHATLTQVLFERGADWVTFVWDGDALAGVLRGLGPVVVGDLVPLGADAFEGADAVLAFDRGTDGRVAGLSLGGRTVADR